MCNDKQPKNVASMLYLQPNVVDPGYISAHSIIIMHNNLQQNMARAIINSQHNFSIFCFVPNKQKKGMPTVRHGAPPDIC
jgi:hypothetical protein